MMATVRSDHNNKLAILLTLLFFANSQFLLLFIYAQSPEKNTRLSYLHHEQKTGCHLNATSSCFGSMKKLRIAGSINSNLNNFKEAADYNLAETIKNISGEEFIKCSLVIVYEKYYLNTLTLDVLLQMPTTKQIFELSENSFLNLEWKVTGCVGYFFLLYEGSDVIRYMNNNSHNWDYGNRYIFVAPDIQVISLASLTTIGKNTEHIIGIALVATFEFEPNVFFDRDEVGKVVGYYGLDIQVVETLAQHLNFTIGFMEPPANEYFGGQLPNGSWNGLLGVLSRGEADIAVDDLFFNYDRRTVVDYCGPVTVEGLCFGARTALPIPSWQSLTFPFQLGPWLAFLVSMPFCGLFMVVIIKVTNSLTDLQYNVNFFTCLTPLAALFRQPVREGFFYKNFSIRIFLLGLWFYCFLVTAAYSSNLTAHLTVQRLPRPFDTVRGLRETGLIVGGIGPFIEASSVEEGNQDIKVIASRYREYENLKDIIQDVLKNKAVILSNRNYLEFAAVTPLFDGQEDPRRTLRILKESFYTYPSGMYLTKHSVLKRKFNEIIAKMVEAGLIRKWFTDSLDTSNKKRLERIKITKLMEEPIATSKQTENKVISINMGHLQGIFILVTMSLLLTILVFMSELFHACG